MTTLSQEEFMSQAPAQAGLALVFSRVAAVLEKNRQELNAADFVNGNHGDHMVEIFEIASSTTSAFIKQAAASDQTAVMAGILFQVGRLLESCPENATASVYAQGLDRFAFEFQSYGVDLQDLEEYVRQVLGESQNNSQSSSSGRGKDVLKALLAGLVGWKKAEKGQKSAASWLDMGALFEFGIIYLQAKEVGGSKAEVIARAAAMASPLSSVPYRLKSGTIALQALLQALETDPQGF
jgi:hypothetical protein